MNATIEKSRVATAKKAPSKASKPAPTPAAIEGNAAATVAGTALDLIRLAAKNPSWGYEGGCGDLAAHGNVATDFITTLLEQVVESPVGKTDAIDKFCISETVLLGLLAFDQRDDPEALERQDLIKQAAELLGAARQGAESVPYAFTQLADGIAAAKATSTPLHIPDAGPALIAIEGNEPGTVHVSDRGELRDYVLLQSSVIASMMACLNHMMLKDDVDHWFMADFANHLNHMIYQQENATKLLLDKGGAK